MKAARLAFALLVTASPALFAPPFSACAGVVAITPFLGSGGRAAPAG